ncbi:GNAT family N-acetyltransferase [Microlunatus sp. GCM10028923]|uniref:GNAT family N-acetyltransferase n=1 Tax=Microlunatus sp. GCM10028923 TaxID=3273400 RepID=UPI00360BC9B5
MSGIEDLEIRTFRLDDVDGWARTELQRRHLIDALEKSGDYLAAVLPTGRIVGKIGIRYDEQPGAGSLFQFDVVESLRGQGIGTRLVHRAEQVIRDHGCDRATLGVEDTNEAAIRLYRRLGYQEFGTEAAEWDQEDADGTISRYRCLCLLMCRTLSDDSTPP